MAGRLRQRPPGSSGLTSSTLYGRHFLATQLGAVAQTGTVRGRMGHGSLAVTSIYTHRVAEADRAAARHMGELLDRQANHYYRSLRAAVRSGGARLSRVRYPRARRARSRQSAPASD
jgi:hypothetical protein